MVWCTLKSNLHFLKACQVYCCTAGRWALAALLWAASVITVYDCMVNSGWSLSLVLLYRFKLTHLPSNSHIQNLARCLHGSQLWTRLWLYSQIMPSWLRWSTKLPTLRGVWLLSGGNRENWKTPVGLTTVQPCASLHRFWFPLGLTSCSSVLSRQLLHQQWIASKSDWPPQVPPHCSKLGLAKCPVGGGILVRGNRDDLTRLLFSRCNSRLVAMRWGR